MQIKDSYAPLLGMMAENNMPRKALADAMGITPTSLYYRLRGVRPFTQDDISVIRKLFQLSPAEIDEIFFAENDN